jgi:hypothetical protein
VGQQSRSSEDPGGRSLWPLLLGFLLFCVLVGVLFGLVAYGVVRGVFNAMAR